MGDIRTIRHDAFSRVSIVRKQVRRKEGCDTCGSKRSNGSLFRYGEQPDDSLRGEIHWDGQCFCGMDCREAYYG